MEAALPAHSAAPNPAAASAKPTADVWRCSVSCLFLRMLLGSVFKLPGTYTFSHNQTQTLNAVHTHIHAQAHPHLTPINAHLLHPATGLRLPTFFAPVWRQRKQRLCDYVTQRDSPVRFMWLKCHLRMRKGSHSELKLIRMLPPKQKSTYQERSLIVQEAFDASLQ